jgi:hypothetical protein
MKHILLTLTLPLTLLLFGAVSSAQTLTSSLGLRLPGPSAYPDPGQMIHLERQKDFIVFRIARDIPTTLEKGNDWDLGPHVPYPVMELDFYVPTAMCKDLLSCDSGNQLVDVVEVHITGQHVMRKAGLRYVIKNGFGIYQVDAWMTDHEGDVAAVHTSMLPL